MTLNFNLSRFAAQRNIQLSVHDTQFWVDTDPQWMRRIIQNFVSNALRYTTQGRVVVGVLRSAQRPNHIRNRCLGYRTRINEQQRVKLFQEF